MNRFGTLLTTGVVLGCLMFGIGAHAQQTKPVAAPEQTSIQVTGSLSTHKIHVSDPI